MYQDIIKIKGGDEDLISPLFLGKAMAMGIKRGRGELRQLKQNENFFQN